MSASVTQKKIRAFCGYSRPKAHLAEPGKKYPAMELTTATYAGLACFGSATCVLNATPGSPECRPSVEPNKKWRAACPSNDNEFEIDSTEYMLGGLACPKCGKIMQIFDVRK